MRHSVRRARVQVLRKLVRQSKLLRVKKGDEKHREKYKRKADKLGDEIAAIKKIPDDDVTRYSITSEKSLAEILNDPKSEPEICVIARLASNKIIKNRVEEFKSKFPNFADHLGPGRKKAYKLKRKAGKMAEKAKLRAVKGDENEDDLPDNIESEESADDKEESEERVNDKESEEIVDDKKSEESVGEDEEPAVATEEIKAIKELKTKRKTEKNSPAKKRVKTGPKSSQAKVKPVDKLSGITPTSRESAVKSLTSFLEEKNNGNTGVIVDEGETENKIVLEKEVDSFFMTEDGAGEYLSIVVPKSKETEEEEDGWFDRGSGDIKEWNNSARSRNNRFFDKVDQRDDGFRQRNRRDDSSGKGDGFRDRNKPNSFTKRDRVDFRNVDKMEEKEMHPSWAAKKKEQEILKLGFQGKKIVFDDV